MIAPGRVYRRDTDDATHSHQFHQIEGLVVDKNITMADLKGTLDLVMKKMFGQERELRWRPSYFPFTEPSVEVDISCFKCGVKDVMSANIPVGLKSLVQVWSIQTYLKCLV